VRRRVATVAVSIVVLATLWLTPSASAFGYKHTGFDPNDRARGTNCCYVDPDFRSTTRKVWVDKQKRAWLTITFRTYDYMAGGPYSAFVRLDPRGGPLADFRMHMWDSGDGPQGGCWFRSLTSGRYRQGALRGPDFTEHGLDRSSCRVPLRWLHPNKQIRWALYSPPTLGREEDHAPGPFAWYA
jgi:hypothetical protein